MRTRLGAGLLALALIVLAGGSARGHDVTAGDLRIGHPWARASVDLERPAAAYVTIRNGGFGADRLLRVETPVAARAELHRTAIEGGVASMAPAGALEIAPGAVLMMEPGGLHIMLVGLTRALAQGDRFPVTLVFERAGAVEVEVVTEAAGATGAHH